MYPLKTTSQPKNKGTFQYYNFPADFKNLICFCICPSDMVEPVRLVRFLRLPKLKIWLGLQILDPPPPQPHPSGRRKTELRQSNIALELFLSWLGEICKAAGSQRYQHGGDVRQLFAPLEKVDFGGIFEVLVMPQLPRWVAKNLFNTNKTYFRN